MPKGVLDLFWKEIFLPAIGDWATESWVSYMSQSLEEVRYKQRGSSGSCRTFYLSNWAFLEIQETMKELITKQADHSIYGSFFFAVKGKSIKLFTKDGQEGVHIPSEAESVWSWLGIHAQCYRCLGPSTFFHHSILPTIPLPMGYDNQWWRDLLRDLGLVYRWWCSEHYLLKGWVHHLSPLPFPFHSWTYLYYCQYDYTLHCFMSSCLHSHVSIIDSSLPPHNHAYSYVSFLLILIDIASSAVLSLCTAS